MSGPPPGGWAGLAAACQACTDCAELAATRTHVVVGTAPAPGGSVRLALVGEAPGASEDVTGLPFVGPAGVLLDDLLGAAGLDRAGLAVLNTLKCRPPGNRAPAGAELAACRRWLSWQLDCLDPALVVALGLTAARWFLGRRTILAEVRGRPLPAAGRTVLATYHPSAALRFGPAGRPRALLAEDLRTAAGLLG